MPDDITIPVTIKLMLLSRTPNFPVPWDQLLDIRLAPGWGLPASCHILYSEALLASLLYDPGSGFNHVF
jgi:hypothetical protein